MRQGEDLKGCVGSSTRVGLTMRNLFLAALVLIATSANPASVVTRVSSHGCAASPTMCYAVTEPAPSVR